jgi:SpoIIAA-like
MPIALKNDRDNVYRVEMSGLLRKRELDQCQGQLAAEMRRVGPVRLLIVLEGFEGWEPGANWNDLSFYMKHGDSIERLAIVGDERWRSEALMFAGVDLRKAPVEFFPANRAAEASAWLGSGSDRSKHERTER